jgi:hypothetical protein
MIERLAKNEGISFNDAQRKLFPPIDTPKESLNKQLTNAGGTANFFIRKALSSTNESVKKRILQETRTQLRARLQTLKNGDKNTSNTNALLSLLGKNNTNKTNISVKSYLKTALNNTNNKRKRHALNALSMIGSNLNRARQKVERNMANEREEVLRRQMVEAEAARKDAWNKRGRTQRAMNYMRGRKFTPA